MRRVIVDTNALLHFLLNDVPAQRKTVEKLLRQARNKEVLILVPQIVIFEMEFTLRKYYLTPKDKIIEKLQPIVTMNFIEIENRQPFIMALGYFAGYNISFVDCFLLARSRIEGYELFTFDKKILRAGL